jgi:uncharacterized protein YggE
MTRPMPRLARLSAFSFLILMATLAPAIAQERASESRRGPILTVKGEGRVEVKPELATLDVTVSTKGGTLEEAAGKHRERATRAFAAAGLAR